VIDTDAALTFLSFVQERHRAYLARQAGDPQPWTDDPIVATRKFTNVYRILDYGSQFVMTDLIDPELGPRDQLARLFLYRHTGRVEAWEYLGLTSGYPTRSNLDDVVAAWKEYQGQGVEHTQKRNPEAQGQGGSRTGGGVRYTKFERSVFTGAYLVFPQSTVPGTNKLDSIIDLTRRLFVEADTGADFWRASSQAERFTVLRRNKGVADFMSMQILTDWGYTPLCGEDRENEFVVAGPGARKGAAALGLPPDQAIRWATETISDLRLGDRPPSYMDAQNTLCEFSKYVRFMEKPVPSKLYRPAHPGPQPAPVLPKHW
jgi:hypothetical protein